VIRVIEGDCRQMLAHLEAESVQCCVTSPPYFGLRDYGVDGQIGLEPTVDAYVAELVAVFREVRRVLRDDGCLWLNLGDSYCASPPGNTTKGVSAKSGLHGVNGVSGKYRETLESGHKTKRDTSRLEGLKPKDLIGVPWMVAFALRADGWYLRSDIIWAKPNPMPESVRDRPTKAHEYLFLLTKNARYYWDADAVREPHTAIPFGGKDKGYAPSEKDPHFTSQSAIRDGAGRMGNPEGGRNIRSVWTIATHPFSEAHFATFPPALVEPCIKAGTKEGDTVLDPFFGAGTVGLVADRLGRDCIGIELNPEYAAMARKRISGDAPLLAVVS
jgi:DNA modification methylase